MQDMEDMEDMKEDMRRTCGGHEDMEDSRQPSSSELSVQSMLLSHFLCLPMHSPLEQVN